MNDAPTPDILDETQAAAAAAASIVGDQLAEGRLRDPQQWAALEAERQQLAAEHAAAKDDGDDPAADDEDTAAEARVDVLQLAVDVATDAYESLYRKDPTARRLEHKIALARALADIAQSVIARTQLAMQQQGFAMAVQQHQAQQSKSPSGIMVPTPHLVPNGRV